MKKTFFIFLLSCSCLFSYSQKHTNADSVLWRRLSAYSGEIPEVLMKEKKALNIFCTVSFTGKFNDPIFNFFNSEFAETDSTLSSFLKKQDFSTFKKSKSTLLILFVFKDENTILNSFQITDQTLTAMFNTGGKKMHSLKMLPPVYIIYQTPKPPRI